MSDDTAHLGSCPTCGGPVAAIDPKFCNENDLAPYSDGVVYRKVVFGSISKQVASRLLTMATKHCPVGSRDWIELKKIANKEFNNNA